MAEIYEVSSDGALVSIECESFELFVEGAHPSDVSAWLCKWQTAQAPPCAHRGARRVPSSGGGGQAPSNTDHSVIIATHRPHFPILPAQPPDPLQLPPLPKLNLINQASSPEASSSSLRRPSA